MPLHRRIYVYTPSPLYIYIFTRSHPQIYLCTSISHLYIHTVAPSHPVFLSFFLRFFALVSVHLHLRTLTSTDLPLHFHTSTDLYRTCASHCHSFTSTLSFSLSIHLFDTAGQLHVSLSGQPSSSFFSLPLCLCTEFISCVQVSWPARTDGEEGGQGKTFRRKNFGACVTIHAVRGVLNQVAKEINMQHNAIICLATLHREFPWTSRRLSATNQTRFLFKQGVRHWRLLWLKGGAMRPVEFAIGVTFGCVCVLDAYENMHLQNN